MFARIDARDESCNRPHGATLRGLFKWLRIPSSVIAKLWRARRDKEDTMSYFVSPSSDTLWRIEIGALEQAL